MAQFTRGPSPADRAEEQAAVQRRLKSEAAERRKLAQKGGTKRRAHGLSQTGHAGHRRTP